MLRGPAGHLLFRSLRRVFPERRAKLPALFIDACERPVHAGLLVFALYASSALLRFDVPPFDVAFHAAAAKLLRLVVIVLITWAFARFIGPNLLDTLLPDRGGEAMTRTFRLFFARVLRMVVAALGVVIFISELGYDIGGLIAGLGLGGLTLALAAQDWASNLFGGMVILFDRPFAVGDWIQVEGGAEGIVEDITFRTTRVRTFEDSQVSIPNALLVSKPIINWSRMQKRKISFDIGLSYQTPAGKLAQCAAQVRDALEAIPGISQDLISVTFSGFGESALELHIHSFTDLTGYADYMRVKGQVNFAVVRVVDGLGLSFAYPTRTVRLEGPAAQSEQP